MKRFYSTDIEGGTALLKDNERDHCVRVLRTREGEQVEVVDGSGHLYTGVLSGTDRSTASITLIGEPATFPQRNAPVLASAIPKNHARWEWILEKAVEIGVSAILPIICKRSEKQHIRKQRNEQIMVSAFKQSGHLYLPRLEDPIHLTALIEGRVGTKEDKFIAHCGDEARPYLGSLVKPGRPSLILIGPEGDFTEEEVSLAASNGCSPVSLGASRLRVETAAVVACTIIHSIEQLS